ncbi:hypothetical protein V8E51_008460 [Hyaloscypha variabilis]
MSFGFSIGDIILLVQLAHRTFRRCQKAGEEYNEIACEVHSLHSVLRTLRSEAQRPDSKIFKQDPLSTKELIATADGCKNVLATLDTILAKYEGLKVLEREVGAGKRLWQKLRFGSKTEELGIIRCRLIAYTSTIAVLLDTVQIKAADRVESKIDGGFAEIVGRFEKMRKEIYKMASEARAAARNGSTISLLSLSTHKGDDKEVWQDFRRELIKKGFRSQNLDKYKAVLQAYMLKLDQSGILDEEYLFKKNHCKSITRLTRQMHTEMINSLEDLTMLDAPTSISVRNFPDQEISSSKQPSTFNIDDANDTNESPPGLEEAVAVKKTQRSVTEAWMFGGRIPLIKKDIHPIHDCPQQSISSPAPSQKQSHRLVVDTLESPIHSERIDQRSNEVVPILVPTLNERPSSGLELNEGVVTLYVAPDQMVSEDSDFDPKSGVVTGYENPCHLDPLTVANRITFVADPEIIGISHFPPPPRELRMISIKGILRPPSISFPEEFEAVALFTFDAQDYVDLSFKEGDTITVTKRTESNHDWWSGKIGSRSGIFPSNYVRVKEETLPPITPGCSQLRILGKELTHPFGTLKMVDELPSKIISDRLADLSVELSHLDIGYSLQFRLNFRFPDWGEMRERSGGKRDVLNSIE